MFISTKKKNSSENLISLCIISRKPITKVITLLWCSRILRDYTFYTRSSFRFAEDIVHKFYNVIFMATQATHPILGLGG